MTSLFDTEGGLAAPPESLSKAGFAREIGVSPSRVSQLIKEGLPLTPNGKIPRTAGLAWYQQNIDPNRRKAFNDHPTGSTKSQLEALKVERERLALSKDRGELIDRETARRAIFERARGERDAWIAWSSRMAATLAAELGVDPSALFSALDREVRAQLAELAATPMEDLDHG